MPKQVSMDEVVGEVGKWDGKVRELEAVEGEKIPDKFKLAALTEMCPEEVRDLIYTHADAAGGYRAMREMVVGWVVNKVASRKGMMVGCVGEGQICDWGGNDEIDIGLLKCYQCGGIGHPQRLCPTEKQVKGFGKAAGKGQWQPKGGDFGGEGTRYGKGAGQGKPRKRR